jgi:hypothetical protein
MRFRGQQILLSTSDTTTPGQRAQAHRLALAHEASKSLIESMKPRVVQLRHSIGHIVVRGASDAHLTGCQSLLSARRATTRSARASEDVSPGDSMPNRLTRPATPWSPAPCTTKSALGSPGPLTLGRMPAKQAHPACLQWFRLSGPSMLSCTSASARLSR